MDFEERTQVDQGVFCVDDPMKPRRSWILENPVEVYLLAFFIGLIIAIVVGELE